MCQALRDLEQKGVRRGVRKGRAIERENGIRNLIEDNLEEGIGKERIITKLMKRYHLDTHSAERYYVRFAVC